MPKTLRAVFDGKVLRPEEPVDLKANTRYLLTIEREEDEEGKPDKEDEEGKPDKDEPYPLTEVLRLATDMGVTDLSTRHSWYAHGRLEVEQGGTCP